MAAALPQGAPASRGARRRRSARRAKHAPLIEIARADREADAVAAAERWKASHPKVAAYLEPADVLVDRMRGSSSLWYRVRINLTRVPPRQRPRRRRQRKTRERHPKAAEARWRVPECLKAPSNAEQSRARILAVQAPKTFASSYGVVTSSWS